MRLFTPGPVNLSEEILKIGGQQEPYFRNQNFSEMVLNTIESFHKVLRIPSDYSIYFIPGSGTTAMESAAEFVSPGDNIISIESGIFGERFSEIIKRKKNIQLTQIHLDIFDQASVPINATSESHIHFTFADTSTGYKFKSQLLPNANDREGLIIVDAVTALFTEEIDIEKFDVIYSASQKGIACSPGIGIVICSPKAKSKLCKFESTSLVLDPRIYLENIKKGQTPFTPPINVLFQISKQITEINDHDGYLKLVETVSNRAIKFRNFLNSIGAEILIPNQANCVTNFRLKHIATSETLKALGEKSIQIAPNSPNCHPEFLRVAHFGEQSATDYEILNSVLRKLNKFQ